MYTVCRMERLRCTWRVCRRISRWCRFSSRKGPTQQHRTRSVLCLNSIVFCSSPTHRFIAWLQVVPLMLHTLYLSHMHEAQERVAVRYIPARSCPCRCFRLEPGYKSLITPRLRDMAGTCIYAPYHSRGCYL